jgi:hypothetical protein
MKLTKDYLRKIIRETILVERLSPAEEVAEDFLGNYPEINSEDSYYDHDADNLVVDYATAHNVNPEDVKHVIMQKLGMTF